MIRFEIHGDNLTITDAIRNYIEEKIGKLERYFNDVPNAVAHVKVKTYSILATKIEVTIPLKNVTLRAEKRNDDLYAGIDLINNKLEDKFENIKHVLIVRAVIEEIKKCLLPNYKKCKKHKLIMTLTMITR